MSCEILIGRAETCKDSVGGLKNVYFINTVPVATFEISCGAVTFAVANTCAVPILPTLALPDTVSDVNEPTLVIFG